MADFPGRIYKVAKAYLDAARDRLSDIDSAAQEELRRALPRENPNYMPSGAQPDRMNTASPSYNSPTIPSDAVPQGAGTMPVLPDDSAYAPMNPISPDFSDYTPGSDDPMERAAAKIAATRNQSAAFAEMRGEPAPPKPAPQAQVPLATQRPPQSRSLGNASSSVDPVQTAYRVIGLPMGSDYLTVQRAVEKLRQRCAPANFPAGSSEQKEAESILAQIEDAYRVLQNSLNASEGRFGRLEF